ncbi:MAG: T9SS type A sorting domain-containing protein [Ignavibacteria bacterium]|nr:T9SS type A sorting domain-containing protein [Ignavibacteria bacterium]
MKQIYCLFVFLLSAEINSQWQNVIKINSPYTDKNPAFGVQPSFNHSRILFEFLVFQRMFTSGSQIYTLKVSTDGLIDSAMQLSSISGENINPAIDYFTCQCYIRRIRKAMAVWQSKNNGIWNINGNIFTEAEGWGTEFPIVVTPQNKLNPKICAVDSNHFALVYQTENGDIHFKRYLNGQWFADSNLTSNEPMICINPFISYYKSDSLGHSIIVAYEKRISATQTVIMFTRKRNAEPWTVHDTAAFLGNNKINGFLSSYSGGAIYLTFTSDRSGRKGIYRTSIELNSGYKYQETLVNEPSYDNSSYSGSFASVNLFSQISPLGAFIKKSASGSWIASDNQLVWHLGDSSAHSVLTVGRGVYISPFDIRFWLVFSKDTLNSTNLYLAVRTVSTLNIGSSGVNVPSEFILHQSYPNPFNSVTNIRFELSSDADITLSLFDCTGRELQRLIDNKYYLRGYYEVKWDAADYPSGIYFIRLSSNGYYHTVRTVLVK